MRLNNGLGDVVTTKKTYLVTYNKSDDVNKIQMFRKITAVQHGDGISFGSSPIL
jgi:hypothetical protein